MALRKLLDAWKNLKTNWKAAKLLARGKSINVDLVWSYNPPLMMRLSVREDREIDVNQYRQFAVDSFNHSIGLIGLKLADPGDPEAFLVKMKREPQY